MMKNEDNEAFRRPRSDRPKPADRWVYETGPGSFLDHVQTSVKEVQELADDPMTFWRAGFDLARKVKAHAAATGLTPRQAWRVVSQFVEAEFSLMLDADDLEAAFFDAWAKARLPEGMDPLDKAVQLAQEKLLPLGQEVSEARPASYIRFISIAGWLTVVLNTDTIRLPVERLAKLLGLKSARSVSTYRQWAQEDGFLVQVREHCYLPGRQGEATTFKFSAERFPLLMHHLNNGTTP